MSDSVVDLEEYKKYRFLYFMNFSKLLAILDVSDRKILASALMEFEPQGDMLKFVKKEVLYKLSHEPISQGGEMINSLLFSFDKMQGGNISKAMSMYFSEVYSSLDETGRKFVDAISKMKIIPAYIKKQPSVTTSQR